ncbi:MAG: enoyl-CoA hydratase-related protein [Dongiaceae bacterium]
MIDNPILLDISGPIARLTLNRPNRLNSFTRPMLTGLFVALGEVAAAKHVRVLVLTGTGRAFCSGQDLAGGEALAGPELAAALLRDHYNPVIRALRALEMPVVAAVNGIAAGAGCSLALACDLAIAARSASFMLAFSKIGRVPDAGSTFFLPRIVGSARAMGLAMLGEPVSAETAAQWGLILEAVPDENFSDRVEAVARALADRPTRALALAKRAILSGETASLEAQLDLEADLQAETVQTDDAKEGITAFLEKRAAVFRGH